MPWHVERTSQCPASKPWGVILDADGKVVSGGCHSAHAMANRHMAALYANEPASTRAALLTQAAPYLSLPSLPEQVADLHSTQSITGETAVGEGGERS